MPFNMLFILFGTKIRLFHDPFYKKINHFLTNFTKSMLCPIKLQTKNNDQKYPIYDTQMVN